MIETLVFLLILAVVVVIVVWIMGIVPVDARIKQIAYLVLFLIVVLALLDHFGIYHMPR
jgi:hypothetical protein